jgi:alpha-D-xyloside xylohydrolase
MKKIIVIIFLLGFTMASIASNHREKKELANGIIRLSLGTLDKYTPYVFCPEQPKNDILKTLPEGKLPFSLDDIDIQVTSRGCQVSIPLQDDEQLYGFGLQIGSFQQNGLKKKPIVNDSPINNLGLTHAPQPFYVSTKGYGIIINTLRYSTFYCGTNKKKFQISNYKVKEETDYTSIDEIYKNKKGSNFVYVDIPNCKGIDVIIIKGINLQNVLQKYILFSGGGCLPPLWGLGFKYRTKTDFTQCKVMRIQEYFRTKQIPCDVIGLEPGWQSNTYSCSYIWNKNNYPTHQLMLNELKKQHYKINLWEHAYVNQSSPLWEPLKNLSGDFLVWDGLVPDFVLSKARKIFAEHHKKLIDEGICGFKLDECDNSNIVNGNSNWGFPEMSCFPSGIDGEQMHQIFGVLYLETLNNIYKKENKRTYQDYRSSGLFVSSISASLYSDIYNHKDYVQMICNSAFGGLLWSPEVRESSSRTEFFHRLQTVLLSAQAVVDSWFLQNPPWLQYDKNKNNSNIFLPDSTNMENITRKLINIRMQLIPYIYSSFAKYTLLGITPFRPLVMDFPEDKNVWSIDDQYMMGDNLLVAPLLNETQTRKVYFPKGEWYNFNTNEKYIGGKTYEISIKWDEMPLFVKTGTILPLAKPVQYIDKNTIFHISCIVYGNTTSKYKLFEDDGESYNYKNKSYNLITLYCKNKNGYFERKGNFKEKRYIIDGWTFIN